MNNKTKNMKNKKSGGFNTVDILLTVMLLAAIFLIFVVLDPLSWISNDKTEKVTVNYTVEIKQVDDEFKNSIISGNKAVNASSSYNMGTVVSVDVQDAYTWEYEDGKMVKTPVGGKSDLLVALKVDAIYEPGVGYLVDGKHIAVGSEFNLRFPGFIGSGYCIHIERAEK